MNEETIELKINGISVFYDKSDHELVSKFKWKIHNSGKILYCRSNKMVKGVTTYTYMHRLVMGNPNGCLIDHKDRNGLNNVKSNLRMCNRSQNAQNTKLNSKNVTGYRGVCFLKRTKKYNASIRYQYRKIFIGDYDNEIDAAKAYNEAAKKYFNEFATLNRV